MPDTALHMTTLLLRPDVVATVLEDGAVLLDLETKYFYSANPAAWAIIQMFETGATREQVIQECLAHGAESQDTASIHDLIETLMAERLIVPTTTVSNGVQLSWSQAWSAPHLEKFKEPLQQIMTSAFDPSLPLAE